MFSCEFFKSTFFTEQLWETASAKLTTTSLRRTLKQTNTQQRTICFLNLEFTMNYQIKSNQDQIKIKDKDER